jgi:histidinol-phosphate phosphatase family protein
VNPTHPPTQAVILAGGRGTRMRPLTDTRPKAMIEFHGKPFLQYVLEMLRDQGIQRVQLLLGYLPEVITDHFGDGRAFGLEIEYSVSDPDDLTAHRVQLVRDRIDDLFMLLYCDNYWPLRMADMWETYLAHGAPPAQITVYANRDGFSRSSVIVGPDGRVEVFDRARTTPNLQGVEISYAILRKEVLELLPADGDELFEVAVYPELVRGGELYAYWSEHRYYSVGSIDRLPVTESFLARHPAVILDRDGVLNAKPPRAEYVTTPAELQWLPGALDALRLFREAGYKVIVVSNQAGIGRNVMTEQDLATVMRRMYDDAEAAGGRIDAFYHCPHDWDEGCRCRKPAPGMLFSAQRDHHLDLTRTTFVGDDDRDGVAALAAGCPFEQVDGSRSLLDITRQLLDRSSAPLPMEATPT